METHVYQPDVKFLTIISNFVNTMLRTCWILILMLFLFSHSFAAELSVEFKEAEDLFNSSNQLQSIPMFEKLIQTLETEASQRDLTNDERLLLARSCDLLGQAQFNNNEQAAASAAFLKLLEWDPDYKMNEDLVSKKILDLFNVIKRDNLAMLTVRSNPEGATVFLDKRNLGTTNLENESVTKGTHKLEIRLNGYQSVVHDIEIPVGAMKEISVQLAKDASS